MRNGFLWSNVVFEKKVIYHSNISRAEAVFKRMKAHQICAIIIFIFYFSLFSSNFDDKLSQNIVKDSIFHAYCWDTPSENTGLWQKTNVYKCLFYREKNCDCRFPGRSFTPFLIPCQVEVNKKGRLASDSLASRTKIL